MKSFLVRWLCTTVAVAVAAWVTQIPYAGWGSLLGASFLLGLVNAFLRPVLLILSAPFIVVTLGFFIFIVNGLLFWMVSALVPGFAVSGFWQAFICAFIVSIVNWTLSLFFRGADGKVHSIGHSTALRQSRGRVIDIDVDSDR